MNKINDGFFDQFEDIKVYDYEAAMIEDIRNALNDLSVDLISTADYYPGVPERFLEVMVEHIATGLPDSCYWEYDRQADCCLFGNYDLLEKTANMAEFDDVMAGSPREKDEYIREYLFLYACGQAYKELTDECYDYLTDKELLFLLLISEEWDQDYLNVAAKRVDMSNEWNRADSENFMSVVYEIIKKLKERASV